MPLNELSVQRRRSAQLLARTYALERIAKWNRDRALRLIEASGHTVGEFAGFCGMCEKSFIRQLNRKKFDPMVALVLDFWEQELFDQITFCEVSRSINPVGLVARTVKALDDIATGKEPDPVKRARDALSVFDHDQFQSTRIIRDNPGAG